MEICNKCNNQILSTDQLIQDGDKYIHATCPDNSDNSKPHFVIEREESRRDTKASVITKIDLSWSNVFWLAFQYIVVLHILAVPIALIYLIIFIVFD